MYNPLQYAMMFFRKAEVRAMYEFDRLQAILEYLREKRSASVHSLADQLYVSEATIRRDLNALETQGRVRRVFGGVKLLDNDRTDVPFHANAMENYDIKSAIAVKALDFIHDGDVLMLDASFTVSLLLPHLTRFSGLTIITNANMTMPGLQELDAKVYCTGGLMLRNSQGFIGDYAETMIRNFHADKLFFTCRGLSFEGQMSELSAEETSLHRVMMQHSSTKILLCDSTKFGRQYCYNLGNLNDVDEFISDKPLQQ